MTRSVGGYLEAISAELHAAPAAVFLLAGVVEMQNTVVAFANLSTVRSGKQNGGAVSEGSEQIFRFHWFKILFHCQAVCIGRKSCGQGVLGQQPVQFVKSRSVNRTAIFPTQDFSP